MSFSQALKFGVTDTLELLVTVPTVTQTTKEAYSTSSRNMLTGGSSGLSVSSTPMSCSWEMARSPATAHCLLAWDDPHLPSYSWQVRAAWQSGERPVFKPLLLLQCVEESEDRRRSCCFDSWQDWTQRWLTLANLCCSCYPWVRTHTSMSSSLRSESYNLPAHHSWSCSA